MRAGRVAIALAGPVIGMIACASFGTSDPAGGAKDGAPAADGARGGDAASEAGWLPCAQRPPDPAHFCEDFDEDGRIGFGWDVRQSGGWLDASAAALSPPRALLSHVDPDAGGVWAYLRRSLDGADGGGKSKATLAASVRVDRAPYASAASNSYLEIAVLPLLRCPSGPVSYVTILFGSNGDLRADALHLTKGCDTVDDFVSVASPLTFGDFVGAGYRRLTLELRRTDCAGAPGGSFTFAVDGHPYGCQTIALDPLAAPLDLQLGIYASDVPRAADVTYDDVTVDFE